MNDKKFIFTLLVLLPFAIFAQEQLGLRFENYSGVNGLFLNPANALTSKFKWDINLVEAGIFTGNNIGFIANTSAPDLVKNGENVRAAIEFENPDAIPARTLLFDFYQNSRKKFLSFNGEITGPSFMINLADKHSFGVFTRFRNVVSGQGLPGNPGYYSFEQTPLEQGITIAPLKIAGMSWSELGFNYGIQFPGSSGIFGLGLSVKFLNGYEGFYATNNAPLTVTQHPGDSVSFSNIDFSYGFTTSAIDAGGDYSPQRNGGGIGFDIGAVWTIDENEEEYKIKLGASLLDIGKISFSRNSEKHQITTRSNTGFRASDFDTVTELDEATELLSELLINDPSGSRQSGNIGIWLPAAISLQADFKLMPFFYTNATLVQRLPLPGPIVARNNLLAVSPRFEHRWFSFSVPVLLYNWQDIRIGSAIRLAFLTLGSDHVGSIFRKTDFTGTDFYLALKVNPFHLGWGNNGGNGKRGKNVRCYDF